MISRFLFTVAPKKGNFDGEHIDFLDSLVHECPGSVFFGPVDSKSARREMKERSQLGKNERKYPTAVWIFLAGIAEGVVLFAMSM